MKTMTQALAARTRATAWAWATLVALGTGASGPALASSITVHIGPPAVGSGGGNPVSVPPVNPIEYEFQYVSDGKYETNVAVTPGLLFGKRSESTGGVYVGFGGGLVLSSNGTGPGVYSSLGVNLGKTWQFNAELKQALGYDFSRGNLVHPYAIRIGLTYQL
jgi:hypothetical protein